MTTNFKFKFLRIICQFKKVLDIFFYNLKKIKMISTKPNGHIEVIFGPMFSGKSSELQRKVRKYLL